MATLIIASTSDPHLNLRLPLTREEQILKIAKAMRVRVVNVRDLPQEWKMCGEFSLEFFTPKLIMSVPIPRTNEEYDQLLTTQVKHAFGKRKLLPPNYKTVLGYLALLFADPSNRSIAAPPIQNLLR